MTTAEYTTIYAAGFGLLGMILLLVALHNHINDARPMAKIRVHVEDRRRSYAPPEENDIVQEPNTILVGLMVVLFGLGMIALVASQIKP